MSRIRGGASCCSHEKLAVQQGARRAFPIAVAVATVLACATATAADTARGYHFDLSSRTLSQALRAYGQISGQEIIFTEDVVAGMTSAPLHGEYTAQEALDQLLRGTGLTSQRSASDALMIRAAATNTTSAQSAGASAQTDSETSVDIDEIVVSARRFLSEDTRGTTNLPLPIEDVPQAITLVSSGFIETADLRKMHDIAQYTAGATYAGNPGGQGSRVLLRGFPSIRSVDGLTVTTTGFGAAVDPDFAIIDRFEVAKGPSSVVYGAASPGGVINLVTKSARTNPGSSVALEAGSWDYFRFEGQAAAELDDAGRFAAIGVIALEQGHGFRRLENFDKRVAFGRIDADFTATLKGSLAVGYEDGSVTSFDGIPFFADGTAAPVSRSFFIGSKEAELNKEATFVNGGLEWKPSSNWELGLKLNVRAEQAPATSPYAYGLQDNGDFSISATRLSTSESDDANIGAFAIYSPDELFGQPGSFVSASVLRQRKESRFAGVLGSFSGSFSTTANIFDGVSSITQTIESATYGDTLNFDSGTELNYLVYSMQGYLRLTDPVSLLLGVSRSELDTERFNLFAGTTEQEFPGETSLRAALTYEFLSGVHSYISYSESFEPQFASDVNGNVLPPLSGEQYEIGIKYTPENGHYMISGAVFELNQVNRPEFDQNIDGTDRFRAMGEVRHRGVELEVVGRVTQRLQVKGGVSYLDPEVSVSPQSPELVGRTIPFLPETSVNFFADYSFNDQLSVGAGARHVGSAETDSLGTTRELPSYTVVDLAAGYQIGRWQLRLNVHNLFDEKYYVNNYDSLFYGNDFGRPLNFSVSARVNFD